MELGRTNKHFDQTVVLVHDGRESETFVHGHSEATFLDKIGIRAVVSRANSRSAV